MQKKRDRFDKCGLVNFRESTEVDDEETIRRVTCVCVCEREREREEEEEKEEEEEQEESVMSKERMQSGVRERSI
jgi:hypothetical protein